MGEIKPDVLVFSRDQAFHGVFSSHFSPFRFSVISVIVVLFVFSVTRRIGRIAGTWWTIPRQ